MVSNIVELILRRVKKSSFFFFGSQGKQNTKEDQMVVMTIPVCMFLFNPIHIAAWQFCPFWGCGTGAEGWWISELVPKMGPQVILCHPACSMYFFVMFHIGFPHFVFFGMESHCVFWSFAITIPDELTIVQECESPHQKSLKKNKELPSFVEKSSILGAKKG